MTHDDAAGVPEAGSKSLKPGFWLSWKDNLHATGAARLERTSQSKTELEVFKEVDGRQRVRSLYLAGLMQIVTSRKGR